MKPSPTAQDDAGAPMPLAVGAVILLPGRGERARRQAPSDCPHERIRYTDRFDDPNLPGVMQVTVALTRVSCGTAIGIVQEGVPEVIPVEMCDLGWQESLAQLTDPRRAGNSRLASGGDRQRCNAAIAVMKGLGVAGDPPPRLPRGLP